MEFFYRAPTRPARLGILPGAFNPVTVAHLALAGAGLEFVDEVVFVLPRVFPHKHYSGPGLADRLALLGEAIREHPRLSVAVSERGLFSEIATECRGVYGDSVRLSFLCGRDAAERIAGWDYGREGAFQDMLRDFDLLVAPRAGEYRPDEGLDASIRLLRLPENFDLVSATEVRERIAGGRPWEHLVPAAIRDRVRALYGATESAPGSPAGT
jgi:nicotinate-nucleotide adenylyltransferase